MGNKMNELQTGTIKRGAIGAMYQNEETGTKQFIDQQQINWGFEKNNPRHIKCEVVFDQEDLIKERDKYKEALEEIKEQFCNIDNCMLEPQEKLENVFKITEEALK